jgi:hypothetical protein
VIADPTPDQIAHLEACNNKFVNVNSDEETESMEWMSVAIGCGCSYSQQFGTGRGDGKGYNYYAGDGRGRGLDNSCGLRMLLSGNGELVERKISFEISSQDDA